MSTYLSFEIERRGSVFVARRKTKTMSYQLSPARTMREIRAKIDRYWVETPFEEW